MTSSLTASLIMSMSSRRMIAIPIKLLAIGAFAAVMLFFLTQPRASNSEASHETKNNVLRIEPIAIVPTKLATYYSRSYPLKFQHPDGWLVDDTMGGITVTSFKSYAGYSVGTVPEGGFQIDLSLSKKSSDSLDVWCRKPLDQGEFNKAMNLIISTSVDEVQRKGRVVAFDFRSQTDPAYSARVVCIEDNGIYIAIEGFPLTAAQLPLLNIIVNSVTADHSTQVIPTHN